METKALEKLKEYPHLHEPITKGVSQLGEIVYRAHYYFYADLLGKENDVLADCICDAYEEGCAEALPFVYKALSSKASFSAPVAERMKDIIEAALNNSNPNISNLAGALALTFAVANVSEEKKPLQKSLMASFRVAAAAGEITKEGVSKELPDDIGNILECSHFLFSSEAANENYIVHDAGGGMKMAIIKADPHL